MQDAVTDDIGEPCGLGGDDRGQGGQDSSLGVTQAQQGFGADDDVAVDVNYGLEDQRDAVVA